MIQNIHMNRRRFLMGLAALPAGITIGGIFSAFSARSQSQGIQQYLDEMVLLYASCASEPSKIDAFNQRHGRSADGCTVPCSESYQGLLNKLSARISNESAIDSSRIRKILQSLSRQDYQNGELIDQDGWLVSKTEGALMDRARVLSEFI